jgi:hypothetical protein
MPVHFKSATIVHRLLLLLKLTHLFANSRALRNGANRILTFLGVNTEKRPDTLTNSTTALNLDLTHPRMLQVLLHLGAISRRASLRTTTRRMLDELNVQHEVALTLKSLLFCESATSFRPGVGFHRDGNQSVRAGTTVRFRILETFLTQVVVLARITMETLPAKNFSVAMDALLDKLWGIAVVQVPEEHE